MAPEPYMLEQSSILGSMLDVTVFLHHYAKYFIWQWLIVTSSMVLMLPLMFPKTLWNLHQMFKNISFEPSYMSTKTLLLLPCSQKQVWCLLPLVMFFLPYTFLTIWLNFPLLIMLLNLEGIPSSSLNKQDFLAVWLGLCSSDSFQLHSFPPSFVPTKFWQNLYLSASLTNYVWTSLELKIHQNQRLYLLHCCLEPFANGSFKHIHSMLHHYLIQVTVPAHRKSLTKLLFGESIFYTISRYGVSDDERQCRMCHIHVESPEYAILQCASNLQAHLVH